MLSPESLTKIVNKLKIIYEDGYILYSKFNKSELVFLEPRLLVGSMICIAIGKRQSKVIKVKSKVDLLLLIDELENKIKKHSTLTGVGVRSNNIARGGHSKQGNSRIRNKPILIRGFHNCILKSNNTTLDISKNTSCFGTSAVTFKNDIELITENKPIVVFVENLETFMHAEVILNHADILLWYSGNIDHELYDIFNHRGFKDASVIVFADYDVIGLQNYFRIKEKLAKKSIIVSFYYPEDICDRIIHTKNNTDRNLLHKQSFSKFVNRLSINANKDSDPMIMNIIKSMIKSGNGFEQEGLFVKSID